MFRQYFIDISKGFIVLAILAAGLPCYARGALVITSESLKAERRNNTAVFEGSVVARGDSMVLSAGRMTVSYGEEGSIKTLVAEGAVRLVRGLQVLTSDRAVYDLASNSMVFTGEPRAVDEGNVLMGDTISYYLEDDRIKVEKSTMFIDEAGKGPGSSDE